MNKLDACKYSALTRLMSETQLEQLEDAIKMRRYDLLSAALELWGITTIMSCDDHGHCDDAIMVFISNESIIVDYEDALALNRLLHQRHSWPCADIATMWLGVMKERKR